MLNNGLSPAQQSERINLHLCCVFISHGMVARILPSMVSCIQHESRESLELSPASWTRRIVCARMC